MAERLIVARLRSPALLRAVAEAAGPVRVVPARTLANLDALGREEACAAIVYEPGYDGPGHHEGVARVIGSVLCPVVIAMSLGETPGAVAELLEVLRRPHEHCAFAVFPDEVQRVVRSALAQQLAPSAVPALLNGILPTTPFSIHPHVIRAACITQFASDVGDLANACRVAGSTLRDQFRAASVAPPRVWIGAFRSIHAADRCLRRGMNVAKAAKRGGFPSQSDLGHCVKRWTGHSLTWWAINGGFDELMIVCTRRCMVG